MSCSDIICAHQTRMVVTGGVGKMAAKMAGRQDGDGGLWRLSSASRHGQGPKAPLSAGSLAGSGLPRHHVWPRHNTMV